MVDVASVVGGGNIGIEIRLGSVLDEIGADIKRYEPEQMPALYLRFDKHGAAVTLYTSGKYNISGASSIEELYNTNNKLIKEMDLILERDLAPSEVEIWNIVFVDNYGEQIDLHSFIQYINEGQIEYEPEQFPCLEYYPPDYPGLFKIFSTGKITLTGVGPDDPVEEEFRYLKDKIIESQKN